MPQKTKDTFGYSETEFRTFRKYGLRYLILFSLLYCFLYCTRLNLSGAGAAIIRDLSVTNADIGILTGTLFWAYGIGQLINGRFGEVIGTSKFIFLAVVLSCGMNLLVSFQSSILVMAVLWGINGFVQSMAWAPGLAELTNWWPGKTRGFATGFAHAFSGFGQVAATLTVALSFAVLPSLGFRAAFLIPVIFPLVLLVVFKIFTRSGPEKIGLAPYREENTEQMENEEKMRALVREKGVFAPYKYVLSGKKFLIWGFIVFICGLARYGLSTWIPLYFVERFDMDISAGLLGSLTLPVGMGIGTFIVPVLTDRFCPQNRLPAVIFSAVFGALCIGGIVLLDPRIPSQMVLLQILLFLAGFCIYAISGTACTYGTDIGGRVFSGTSTGILDFSAYMGAGVQSVVFGFLLRHMGWNTVFVSVAALCLIVALLGFFGSPKKKAHSH